jgi:hypothetical protein
MPSKTKRIIVETATILALYFSFVNPRSAYNRASGKVDILGRNKQQQERERFLSRENQRKRYKFLSQSVRDPLSADRRQLHSTIENLDDLRLYKTLPSVQHKQY